jgi:hypothetical protein
MMTYEIKKLEWVEVDGEYTAEGVNDKEYLVFQNFEDGPWHVAGISHERSYTPEAAKAAAQIHFESKVKQHLIEVE